MAAKHGGAVTASASSSGSLCAAITQSGSACTRRATTGTMCTQHANATRSRPAAGTDGGEEDDEDDEEEEEVEEEDDDELDDGSEASDVSVELDRLTLGTGQSRLMFVGASSVNSGNSLDLLGVVIDGQTALSRLRNASVHLSGHTISAGYLSRADMLRRIGAFFDEKLEVTTSHWLWFSGHGNEQGDWYLGQDEEIVRFEDVLAAWKKSKGKAQGQNNAARIKSTRYTHAAR